MTAAVAVAVAVPVPTVPVAPVAVARGPLAATSRPAEQADGGGRVRAVESLVHAAGARRGGDAHRKVGDLLRDLGEAAEQGAATGEDDAAGKQSGALRTVDLVEDERRHLPCPWPDDLGEVALRHLRRLLVAH